MSTMLPRGTGRGEWVGARGPGRVVRTVLKGGYGDSPPWLLDAHAGCYIGDPIYQVPDTSRQLSAFFLRDAPSFGQLRNRLWLPATLMRWKRR